MNSVFLVALDEQSHSFARELVSEFDFSLLCSDDWQNALSEPYVLVVAEKRLYLMPIPSILKIKTCTEFFCYLYAGKGALFVDFTAGKNSHRRHFGGGKNQNIVKAIGIQKGVCPSVLDVSAGFGSDAFVLATQGSSVILLERNPVIFCLLRDGIHRALNNTFDNELKDIVSRMQLKFVDAMDFFRDTRVLPQVAYFDPMFPEKKKQVASNKNMVAFQQIVGKDNDASLIMNALLGSDFSRIVVKRPRLAPELVASPELVFKGKSGRFDVYPRKKLN